MTTRVASDAQAIQARQRASPFAVPIRVYWEDTDAGGIVYYANYLKFMERARTEWLRALGIEQEALLQQHSLMFVVVDVQAHFRKPARYGELLRVTVRIAQSTRASLTFEQHVYRDNAGNDSDADLLLDGEVRVACLDAVKFRPRALPELVLQEIGNDR